MKRTLALFVLLLATTTAFAQDSTKNNVPDTVKVGAYIISVHDINFHDKEYTIRFWLWFVYDNPDFDFSKQLDIPNAKEIEPPEIINDSIDGKAWTIMKMKCTMKESWDVKDFPFDSQHLRVQIENTLFDNKHLIFVPDVKGSRFDEKEAIDGWNITHFQVINKENDYETGFGDASNPAQVFSTFNIEMDLERDAWGLFLKIFIGMYIAFLIAMVSFTPHPSELEPRFGLPVGGLFAAVGNKYIIDSLLPESSAFTLVDTLHTFTFFAVFITLVVSALSLKLHDAGKIQQSERVNSIGSRFVIAAYVSANLIAILLALN
ncbi:ligand-gated ion channel [Pseudochryseolinea flava]|uniref:Neurotransmitter-gated ion-channel ligand-binding domain-containing protein n=1 Tax=Pseudochryseolinea flava TaxID=2059302 RepID=A0A364XZT3_9BACT|nr:hypothetical protein [Pseudochryseolinea flava]RAV99840.1 hypothetical protein DQQ10_17520 [Pseudochryseolinea flava]